LLSETQFRLSKGFFNSLIWVLVKFLLAASTQGKCVPSIQNARSEIISIVGRPDVACACKHIKVLFRLSDLTHCSSVRVRRLVDIERPAGAEKFTNNGPWGTSIRRCRRTPHLLPVDARG